MIRIHIVLVLFASLLLFVQTAHAQPPPTGVGTGADGPRGAPTEIRPGQPRVMEPGSGNRRQQRSAAADEQETERLRRQLEPHHRDREGRVHERLRWEEAEAIRQWYRDRDQRPSPGLADGRRDLPPGLQRRMERGDGLPPGWVRKVGRGEVLDQAQVRFGRRIDDELRRRLPRQPDGTILLETEDQVIRVLEATGEVLDVLGIGR
ncbi:hypothetical protein [Thioalkalivibrio thiocyanodenitrificans]|uniref:hypothetical protein n=1 Tax=Thioalkalivibrio thiocyanodenitrificans TaxID=243063 RepID=UPI000367A8AF|nr:hypothetical protein [Thioalkalivibrio thiocyanodenitrificans]